MKQVQKITHIFSIITSLTQKWPNILASLRNFPIPYNQYFCIIYINISSIYHIIWKFDGIHRSMILFYLRCNLYLYSQKIAHSPNGNTQSLFNYRLARLPNSLIHPYHINQTIFDPLENRLMSRHYIYWAALCNSIYRTVYS